MSRLDPQINLRVPAWLKEQIKKEADANRRSVNAEIVKRLEDSVDVNERNTVKNQSS